MHLRCKLSAQWCVRTLGGLRQRPTPSPLRCRACMPHAALCSELSPSTLRALLRCALRQVGGWTGGWVDGPLRHARHPMHACMFA